MNAFEIKNLKNKTSNNDRDKVKTSISNLGDLF